MEDSGFDALTRRAADVLGRRDVLGVLTGVALAGLIRPHRTVAKKDPHHGDGGSGGRDHGHGGGGGDKDKDKIDKKQCQQEYDDARRYWTGFCFRNFDSNGDGTEQPTEFVLSNCLTAFVGGCTAILLQCTKKAQAKHIACVDDLASWWGY
jgi:hypothetical protein